MWKNHAISDEGLYGYPLRLAGFQGDFHPLGDCYQIGTVLVSQFWLRLEKSDHLIG